jgi:hypothetical protein
MKYMQYFPHDVETRHVPGIIELIEVEGASGYGFYWVLLEYLRMQDGYIGSVSALQTLGRQIKVRLPRATRVLYDYGLFVIEDGRFYSPMLMEGMKPLEEKRASKKG